MGRAVLASGELGQLNGLPVSVIVSTTLQELEAGTGQAVTAGGALLPMRDVIRMASHSYHYLTVFDKHTNCALYLGRTRRTASPAQRIVLHAKDRGCTRPGCTVPGYWCQVHHAEQDWADDGQTNIDDLIPRTTAWSNPAAGPLENAKMAAPNGSRHPTSTVDRPG
jgi:Domain of unknown function (DUF222)